MRTDQQAVRISRVHAYHVRVPLAEPTGRTATKTNFIVRLDLSTPQGVQQALGECQPRAAETGDSRSRSWRFLLQTLQELQGEVIDFASRESALAWVRDKMRSFVQDARTIYLAEAQQRRSTWSVVRGVMRGGAELLGRRDPRMPYRGVLFGIETALLDAAARVLGISVPELLGPLRDAAPVRTRIAVEPDEQEILKRLRQWLGNDPAGPAWVHLQARLEPSAAESLIERVADGVARKELPQQIIIEEPLGLKHRTRLSALQKRAVVRHGAGDVRIMTGGQSVWGLAGLRAVQAGGGCRALHIRPASSGGLLASIALAKEAVQRNPDLLVVLSHHDGATRIARRATEALAVALPGLAYVLNAGGRSGTVDMPTGIGLGTSMPYGEVVDTVTAHEAFPPVPEPTEHGPKPNEYEEVTYLQPLGPNGTKGHLLERQALSLGLQTRRFSKGAFTASDGINDPLLIKWSRSPLSSAVSLALCTHKEATRIRLAQAAVPVPQGRTFVNSDLDSARAFAGRIGYPVVVKPAMGVRGIGVVANIQNRDELDLAFEQLASSKLGDQDVIVEKHIPGNDYRIVVVGEEVIAAILRVPASVVGDGESTIAELMIRKNLMRRRNPHLWGRPILYDSAAEFQLQRVGMSLESVPPKGERVMLSNSNSLSQGGDSTDVLDELHPSIKEACVKAVKAIPGLAFCGVDFLIEDHTRPLDEQVAGICELNAHAAIGNCEYPLYGQPRQVAQAFMDECVRKFALRTADERAEELALKLTIRGRVKGVGYRRWMQNQAVTFGLRGWVRNLNGRTVEAVICGPTGPASALAAAAVLGPRRALPTSVTTTHTTPVTSQSFEIRHNPRRWGNRG